MRVQKKKKKKKEQQRGSRLDKRRTYPSSIVLWRCVHEHVDCGVYKVLVVNIWHSMKVMMRQVALVESDLLLRGTRGMFPSTYDDIASVFCLCLGVIPSQAQGMEAQ
jgi:hypothetical protein